MLQRVMTEGVFDLHVAHRAILIGRVHPIAAVLAKKAEDLTEVLEGDVVEIAEDEFPRRGIHRLVVIAEEPISKLGFMAGLAAFVTNVGRAGDSVIRRCLRHDRRWGRRLVPFAGA